jgi:hypothetical protein
MKQNRLLSLVVALGFLVFGFSMAEAQKTSDKKIKTWAIYYSRFISLREGGRSFSLDGRGNLEKSSKKGETKETLVEADLQEIVKLLQELNLPGTKTKTVKGKKIYDYPYWSFTIELNGKSFLMEGFSFNDAKFLVLTKKQEQIFAKLNKKMEEVGAVR